MNTTTHSIPDTTVTNPGTELTDATVPPVLDTLELVRRDTSTPSEADPSDCILTHTRTSIWDLA